MSTQTPSIGMLIAILVIALIILGLICWFQFHFMGGKNIEKWKKGLEWVSIIAGGYLIGVVTVAVFRTIFAVAGKLIGLM